MRTLVICGALLLAVAADGSAQAPPAVPPKKLDDYLDSWEKKMAGVTTLTTVLTRVDTDKVFKTSTEYSGWAAYMKAGDGVKTLNKAILEMKPKGKSEISEKIVCTGAYIYQFLPATKEIHQYPMAPGKGGAVADNASLGLMFGMKAAVAKARFGLTLAKVDDYYIYVDVTPKLEDDKAEFARARLVLDKSTFLPRQVWLEQRNGNEVLWDMPRSASGVALDARHFGTPALPSKEWKIVPKPAPGAAPPAPVIRAPAPTP